MHSDLEDSSLCLHALLQALLEVAQCTTNFLLVELAVRCHDRCLEPTFVDATLPLLQELLHVLCPARPSVIVERRQIWAVAWPRQQLHLPVALDDSQGDATGV